MPKHFANIWVGAADLHFDRVEFARAEVKSSSMHYDHPDSKQGRIPAVACFPSRLECSCIVLSPSSERRIGSHGRHSKDVHSVLVFHLQSSRGSSRSRPYPIKIIRVALR